MKTMKLAMIGYGNVGRAFTKMLEKRKMYLSEKYDTEILVTAICTRSLGAVLDSNGIHTAAETLPKGDKSVSAMDVITKTDYDILVELTPVNIMTGQPATYSSSGVPKTMILPPTSSMTSLSPQAAPMAEVQIRL